ncbi:uncharacterized mitochondrial protein AtMg00810-like [Arachis hypogaea]|uniref:uncharacterized mitochondrial protein AtMg00810-like n=1 Tax=Arachis hypogaea TaxID=3818 RepID=UPI000DEC9631|nr:uncharacterized protein LOC112730193 [Arachis hypogaea]XP_025636593.1 uncharacterized protein LOC112730749 [Arachis hypogaea]
MDIYEQIAYSSYKVRLVAKGFHQREGLDYGEDFSPVAKPATPEGYSLGSNLVCKLEKAFPLSTIYLLAYVDDILVTGSASNEIDRLIVNLNKVFTLKDLGEMSFSLGIEAERTVTGSLVLKQTKYIRDLLKRVDMVSAKAIPTPMISNLKLTTSGAVFDEPSLYRSIVGGLQYATITRPDIAFAVNEVSQFLHTPLEQHWKAVKRILRYLAGTSDMGLEFNKSEDFRILAFSDSDWAANPVDRKSTTGYCVFLGSNLISWSSRKQVSMSRSSTEAKFRALADVMTNTMWLQKLLFEMHFPQDSSPTLFCDNQSTVLMSQNLILYSRSKHFKIDLHFVRNKVVQQQAHVVHIPSFDQIADVLTKPLSHDAFVRFRTKLRLVSQPSSV